MQSEGTEAGCDTKEGISCCRWTERLDWKWDRAADRRTPRRAGTSSSHRLLAHHFPGRPPGLPELDAQLLREASRAHPALYEPPLRWQARRANRPGRTARYSFRQCIPKGDLCCSKSAARESSRLQAEVRSLWYTRPRTTRSDDSAVSAGDTEPVLLSMTRRTVVRAIRQSGVQQSAPRATRAASTTPVSYQLPMIRGSRVVPVPA